MSTLTDSSTPPPGRQVPPQPVEDAAQDALNKAVRASFNVLRLIMVVLLVAYVASGLFRVGSNEHGLVARFGELRTTAAGSKVFQPGPHWALPDPFDEKLRISETQQELFIDTFLWERRADDRIKNVLSDMAPSGSRLRPGVDGAMITGDKNLSHGLWAIQYHVADGRLFVLNVGDRVEDANLLLQPLAETAIVREAAYHSVKDVIGGAAKLKGRVKSRLQKALKELETGIEIDAVNPQTIEPGPVRPAFLAVSSAEQESAREKDLAQEEAKTMLLQAAGGQYQKVLAKIAAYGAEQDHENPEPEKLDRLRAEIDAELALAGGQAAVRLGAAEADRSATFESIRGEAAEFNYYYEQYQQEPRVAKMRRWVKMFVPVVTNVENEIFYLPSFGDIEIRVNRDADKQREREMRRYQKDLQP